MADTVELRSFSVGSFDNNVYILVDPATGRSVLFDAPTDPDRILAELGGTDLQAILMTHTDPDHVQALQAIRDATGAPVGVHPDDADRLPGEADFLIEDGDVFEYGNIRIEARHTPGHTPGSVSFVTEGRLIAGDTLFPGGPGNTHGDPARFRQITDAIREKLFVLPDSTEVFPGHGGSTTIGAERPHLREWLDRGW